MHDPSLKFYPRYFKWELLNCVGKSEPVRFIEYTDKNCTHARLGTFVLGETDEIVPVEMLSRMTSDTSARPDAGIIRRPTDAYLKACEDARNILRKSEQENAQKKA